MTNKMKTFLRTFTQSLLQIKSKNVQQGIIFSEETSQGNTTQS